MSSSTSSSSNAALLAAAALALVSFGAAAAATSAGATPQTDPPGRGLAQLAAASAEQAAAGAIAAREETPARRAGRIALFPVENLAAGNVPVRELRDAIELALARAGLEVVTGDLVDQFLATHRIRYTGGIDRGVAKAAGEELGVDGILVTAVELYAPEYPKLGLTMRVVAATDAAEVLWTDGVAGAGDESPGLLGLGLIRDIRVLRDRMLRRLSRSLGAALAGKGPRAPSCSLSSRFRPKLRYRSELLEGGQRYSVAVVPFRNLTARRHAGDVVALEFLRGLAAVPAFRVVEPGVIRDIILKNRVVMEGGISLDQVRTLLDALGADLVLAGDVLDFGEAATGGVPGVDLTATLLDGRTGEIVWQSSSTNRGNDRVWFFDLGRVGTASTLTCRMARSAVDEMFRADVKPRPQFRPPEPSEPRPREWVPAPRSR